MPLLAVGCQNLGTLPRHASAPKANGLCVGIKIPPTTSLAMFILRLPRYGPAPNAPANAALPWVVIVLDQIQSGSNRLVANFRLRLVI